MNSQTRILWHQTRAGADSTSSLFMLYRRVWHALALRRQCRYVVVGLLALAWAPMHTVEAQAHAHAQQAAVAAPLPPAGRDSGTDSSRWATITTDTGDWAPGHREFGRYTTLLQCLAAANTESVYRRHTLAAQAMASLLQDTAPEQDTLPARVAAVARACGARFSLATTPVQDLPDLWQLELLARNDTAARAVETRLLTQAPAGAPRFGLIANFIQQYLDQEPARVAIAESLVAHLAAGGPAALDALVADHRELLFYFYVHHNTVGMRAEAEQVIALTHTLPSEHTTPAQVGGYLPALQLACRALMAVTFDSYPDSMPAIVQRIQQEYRHPNVQAWYKGLDQKTKDDYHIQDDKSTQTVAQVLKQDAPVFATHPEAKLTLPIRADYWFLGTDGGDSLPPKPGVVSLIVIFDRSCFTYLTRSTQGSMCTTRANNLTRLVQRYGADGLKITVLARTGGHALFNGPQPPAAEAQTIAWYFHDYLHLPITVAVRQTHFTRLPEPDGRVVEEAQGPPLVNLRSNPKMYRNMTNNAYDYHVLIGTEELSAAVETYSWQGADILIHALLQRHAAVLGASSLAAPSASSAGVP